MNSARFGTWVAYSPNEHRTAWCIRKASARAVRTTGAFRALGLFLCRQLHLTLQRRDIVDAVIVRGLADELAVPPFAKHAAHVLACHSRHRREVALADLKR